MKSDWGDVTAEAFHAAMRGEGEAGERGRYFLSVYFREAARWHGKQTL